MVTIIVPQYIFNEIVAPSVALYVLSYKIVDDPKQEARFKKGKSTPS